MVLSLLTKRNAFPPLTTNYYFETDEQTDLLRKGVSKEHRPDPIVQMGLFMDNNAIPITYELFAGNTNDCLTYRPNFGRIKKQFGLGRVISVEDKGMTTGDNIWYTINTPTKDGYVFSMSARGADKEMKKQVDEKQVVFWSEKFAARAKAEREAVLAKARDLALHPSKYTKATTYGAAKYVKRIEYDKETGEILAAASVLDINEDLIKEEGALDGYYRSTLSYLLCRPYYFQDRADILSL